MLDPLVIAALVELLYQIAQVYLPQFPISKELINAVVLVLLGLFIHKAAVRPLARRFEAKLGLYKSGLLAKED